MRIGRGMPVQFVNSRRRPARSERAKKALRAADPKFRKLLNARQMNFFLTSAAPNVSRLVEAVSGEMRARGGAFRTRHQSERRNRHLEAILLNLFAAHDASPERYVAIGLSRNEYSQRGRYSPRWLSHGITSGIVKGLQQADYIARQTGFRDRGRQVGYRTRIRATQKLVTAFKRAGLQSEMISHASDFELIRLRDAEKVLVEYTDDQLTEQMRNVMVAINGYLSRSFIGLHVPNRVRRQLCNLLVSDACEHVEENDTNGVVDFTKRTLYRVFNDSSFERGGRFYGGWWQDVPSALRCHMYVGHEHITWHPQHTREVDFSSIQPNLAYALLDRAPPEDAYRIVSIPEDLQAVFRPLVKAATLRMLNTSSRTQAIESLGKWYRETKVNPDLPSPAEVVSRVEATHPALVRGEMFYRQVGKTLMFREARIAEKVMLEMNGRGAVVLPVHDSFLVMRGYYADKLAITMREVFLEETGQRCAVRADLTEIEQERRQRGLAPDHVDYGAPVEELFNILSRDRKEASIFWNSFDDWLHGQPWYAEPAEPSADSDSFDD